MREPSATGITPRRRSRLNFLQRLDAHAIRPAAREYYIRRAEAGIKARGNRPAETT